MLDSWLSEYTPDEVIGALEPYVTEERRGRIDGVLASRLGTLRVVIENLHDPHNGAAAIRSLEACGLQTLHVVESAEPFRFSPKVTQGCEKWVTVQRHGTFAAAAAALHAEGFRLYAAVPGADLRLDEIDVTRPAALVFGNEHAGLTGSAQSLCDATFGIPMWGFTQSFNLSVSVAVSLHTTATRRRAQLGAAGDLGAQERARLRARWYALSMDERSAQGILARSVSRPTRPAVAAGPHDPSTTS